jgi:hypothetical protein
MATEEDGADRREVILRDEATPGHDRAEVVAQLPAVEEVANVLRVRPHATGGLGNGQVDHAMLRVREGELMAATTAVPDTG